MFNAILVNVELENLEPGIGECLMPLVNVELDNLEPGIGECLMPYSLMLN